MQKMLFLLATLSCFMCHTTTAWGKVVGRTVAYTAGDTGLKGYLAEDAAIRSAGRKPAVLVVYEW